MLRLAVRRSTERIFDSLAGSRALGKVAAAVTAGKLRVLCYHDVPDKERFARQMAIVANEYTPVSSGTVAAAFRNRSALPARAVWVTFDDGDPSVVTNGVPVLSAYGIRATCFVCPGVIGTRLPFWWQIVQHAATIGANNERPSEPPAALVGRLKEMHDGDRRSAVLKLASAIERIEKREYSRDQMSIDDLRIFAAAGGDIGNHTWDHPMLNQCEEDEQRRQVLMAHEWLTESGLPWPGLFAYPNGNATPYVGGLLGSLGYGLATLFDHRIGPVSGNPFLVSRLRVSASESIPRFRAILSGLHPAAHLLRNRNLSTSARTT